MLAQNKNLKSFRVIIFYKACKMFFLKCFFTTHHYIKIKKVTVIELPNENEQNVINYSQLRKIKMSLVKFQTIVSISQEPCII